MAIRPGDNPTSAIPRVILVLFHWIDPRTYGFDMSIGQNVAIC